MLQFAENATSTCMDNATNYPGVTFDSCAQMIYKNTSLHGTPGKTFSYNSVHLQHSNSSLYLVGSQYGFYLYTLTCVPIFFWGGDDVIIIVLFEQRSPRRMSQSC